MRSAIIVPFLLVGVASCSSPGATDAGTDSGNPQNDGGVTLCDPSSCASKHCGPDNQCTAPCATSADCASNETCCNASFCTNLAKDPQNCGACGTACSSTQFCTGTSCVGLSVANLCQNASASVSLDGIDVDDNAGKTLSSAFTAACSSVQVKSVMQSTPGFLDPGTGRPLIGPGDTLVASGGGFGQKAISYMNGAGDVPVYTMGDGSSVSFVRARDNSVIVNAPTVTLTSHHDYFLVGAATEPVSGTLVFAVYGLYSAGTTAAAYWFGTQTTSLSALSKQYYVYEWMDTNNDGVPNASDAFTLLDSN